MPEFDPGRGGMLGTNDLQATVDRFNEAVNTLTSTVNNMSSVSGSGLTRSPAMSQNAEGATFSSQPGMGSTMASFVSRSFASGSPASPSFASAVPGGPSGSGGKGSGGGTAMAATTSGGPSSGPGMGATPAQMVQGAASSFSNYASGSQNNMMLFNAFGQQMQAEWGTPAQTAQNQAFGSNNNNVWAAAQGNAQGMAQSYSTMQGMLGGGQVAGSSYMGAANNLAMNNQGLGITGATQEMQNIYNPTTALSLQMRTGIQTLNPNASANSMASILQGYAGSNYIGGGSYNSKTGTFNQKDLTASMNTQTGRSYGNLASVYGGSTASDMLTSLSQANQLATSKKNTQHLTDWQIMDLFNQAGSGSQSQIEGADKKLSGLGWNMSQLQNQGQQQSLQVAQQQAQSSTYTDSQKAITDTVTRFTQGVNWFLQKTGLDKAIGGAAGAAATGVGQAAIASVTGGAASVSTTQPMTAQGKSTGSSLSSVPGQAVTAVRDAEGQRGKPYVSGGATPATSFDCSGLVMWAYGQAGVKLPRTSQQQWSALSNKSVPMNQVREGDIVFAAGSDGTANAPGHEALMISNNQIIEAPHTGADIRVRAYNPGEWQHAARPVGGRTSTSNSNSVSTMAGSRLAAGNTGSAISAGGDGDSSLMLTSDADSTLFSGGSGGSGGAGPMTTEVNGAATSNSSAGSGSGASSQTFTGGGSSPQNEALAKQMAQALYGWTGNQWTDGLLPLWTQESGFNTKATNPQSGAYGIAQALPASKYATAGADWKTNPATQIKWGLGYIHDRYGSPTEAETHEKGYNWYGTGGPVVVGDRGPELFVPKQSGTIMSAKDTTNLLRGNTAQVAQAPWTASPAQQLMLDTLTNANSHAQGAGGGVNVTVQVGQNAINVGSTGSGSTTGVSGDVYNAGQQLAVAVTRELEKNEMLMNIAKGVTG